MVNEGMQDEKLTVSTPFVPVAMVKVKSQKGKTRGQVDRHPYVQVSPCICSIFLADDTVMLTLILQETDQIAE